MKPGVYEASQRSREVRCATAKEFGFDGLQESGPSSGLGAMKEMLFNTYVNALLVFVPLGIVAGALQWNPAAVFVLNFLAILPFATILNFATNELCLHAGTFGEVLNGVFGRPVRLDCAFLRTQRLTRY